MPVLFRNQLYYKDIIISSLQFLVNQKRIILLATVIMPNHLQLIWRINNGHKREDVQRDFLKYTAQQIRFDLQANHLQVLEKNFGLMPKTGFTKFGNAMPYG